MVKLPARGDSREQCVDVAREMLGSDRSRQAPSDAGRYGCPMTPRVRSVNVGASRFLAGNGGEPSGIDKRPVPAIEVRAPGSKRDGLGSGVLGDFLGDRRHHGGDNQAVYAVAREELDHWAVELGRDLPDGMFGENLTTAGLEVDGAHIDDLWQVGSAVLRVAAPRIPCATFAAHLGERGWVKRFAARGRSGAYLGVEQPGTIRPGDEVVVLHRAGHGITVSVAMAAYYGDPPSLAAVQAAGCGNEEFQAEYAAIRPRGDDGSTP